MANKNVMRTFNNPKTDIGQRNVFDLSQRHVFSAKAGQILPIVSVDVVPGDKIEIDMANITRTMPLNTAAFARMKQNFDWVFVPYRVLWSRFNEFIAQRNDPRSALYGTRSMENPNMTPMYVPNMSIREMWSTLYTLGGVQDMHGFDKKENAYRLLDLLGYGDFLHTSEPVWDQDVRCNLWRLLAYQKACCQFFRDSVHDPLEDAFAFNVDDVQGTSLENSKIEVVRSTTDLNKMFALRYRPWKKDIITGAVPTMQYGAVSAVPLSQALVGVSTIPFVEQGVGSDVYWKAGGKIFSSSLVRSSVDGVDTGVELGRVYGVNDGSNSQGNVTVNNSNEYSTPVQVRTHHNHPNGTATFPSGTTLFDIIALRKAEAIQKWKERTLRAGFHTDAQFMAHYGVSADEDGRWTSDFIGSFDSSINIDEVITTANNNPSASGSDINNSVGDIAGKGVAVTSGSKLHFESKGQFGVLMCLYSVVPECDYSSYGLDQNNALIERFDYFTPEYENLGLQAIPQSIYNLFDGATTQVIGYGPRYWNYKTALDKVHGEFNYRREGTDDSGSLYDWAIPRRDLTVNDNLPTIGAYYINPHVLDSIFAVAADDKQNTDQFIVNAYFEIKALRPMSVIGLPY